MEITKGNCSLADRLDERAILFSFSMIPQLGSLFLGNHGPRTTAMISHQELRIAKIGIGLFETFYNTRVKTHMANITNCQKTQPFKLLFKMPNTA